MKKLNKAMLSSVIMIFSVTFFLAACKPSGESSQEESGLGKYKKPKLPNAPAEYQQKKNPLEGNENAIAEGKITFQTKCEKCHGEKGDGNGKKADVLAYKPAAFSAEGYLKTRSDGQLYFIIENGSPETDMDAYGPGTNVNFNETQIWQIISFLRKEFTK